VPGSAKGEVLRRVVSTDEKLRMPPEGDALSAKQIAVLRTWAELGAKWPDELAGKEPAEDHWAVKPVKRPAVPEGSSSTFTVQSELDGFIVARLEAKGLSLSPEAEKRTLLRRLHLDLTGLPPSPDEVDAFLKDTAANAYEKRVDALLASPHFGERWGRHW